MRCVLPDSPFGSCFWVASMRTTLHPRYRFMPANDSTAKSQVFFFFSENEREKKNPQLKIVCFVMVLFFFFSCLHWKKKKSRSTSVWWSSICAKINQPRKSGFFFFPHVSRFCSVFFCSHSLLFLGRFSFSTFLSPSFKRLSSGWNSIFFMNNFIFKNSLTTTKYFKKKKKTTLNILVRERERVAIFRWIVCNRHTPFQWNEPCSHFMGLSIRIYIIYMYPPYIYSPIESLCVCVSVCAPNNSCANNFRLNCLGIHFGTSEKKIFGTS